ncbi:toll/interleukin-1 receptor domain-containing protein [Bacillus sp. ISL-40]|uniref:toll/interleukin-1 receptor domain-containing protein n=1 Tax=Bacillus sp. ISL-40 TaxID=2819126 RepID=UPI001BE9C81C|nr:toll/interleukin-1 receptor domain-containing protein [Bacillus sp. ISL-40]MBT2700439.1 toll/interleukin-1 receptor domain-containing protein [Bacillus sp. ISL-40]
MNRNELRKISSQFRRISAQFLSMESDDEFNFLIDLINFIDENSVLTDYVNRCKDVVYDIEKSLSEKSNWRPLVLPAGTEQVISYVYQLLSYFRQNPNSFRGTLFYYSSGDYSEKYQVFTRKTVAPFINYLISYLEVCLIDAEDFIEPKEDKSKVFLSYCSKDIEIADMVDAKLQELLTPHGVYISRDERDVLYRDSFRMFMNSIAEHDFVVMIISDSYLKSRPCMYEVLETMKSQKYVSKMLFIVLSENERECYKNITNDFIVGANIYDVSGRVAYARYWAHEESKLNMLIEEIADPLNKIEPIKELKTIRKILMDIDEFTSMLAERRGIPLQTMKATNYQAIVDSILTKN